MRNYFTHQEVLQWDCPESSCTHSFLHNGRSCNPFLLTVVQKESQQSIPLGRPYWNKYARFCRHCRNQCKSLCKLSSHGDDRRDENFLFSQTKDKHLGLIGIIKMTFSSIIIAYLQAERQWLFWIKVWHCSLNPPDPVVSIYMRLKLRFGRQLTNISANMVDI